MAKSFGICPIAFRFTYECHYIDGQWYRFYGNENWEFDQNGLMQSIGPVHHKRMFGGYGVFLEGLMFGIIADNTLYLKADKETENDFKDKGLEPFTYDKKGKPVSLSYFQAPEETLEDYDETNSWANKAYSTALRAAKSKQR